MPAGSITYHLLNAWVDTTSAASSGVIYRRLIAARPSLISLTDTRM